jgi:hypothetical protein
MTVYAFKSIAVIVTSGAAFVTLIGVKFYTIFKNRQSQAVGGVKSGSTTMLNVTTSTNLPTGGAGKKVPIGASLVHLLKDKPFTLWAPVVYSSKKMGVVFWKAKVAILQIDTRVLYLISVDPVNEKDSGEKKVSATNNNNNKKDTSNYTIPEIIAFPLTKISTVIPDTSGSMGSGAMTASSMGSGDETGTTIAGSSSGSGQTVLTIKNSETGHAVTIQFETGQKRKEFENELKKMGDIVTASADGSSKKDSSQNNLPSKGIKSSGEM